MLQKIRDNASGPLAYVVVAVIALVFGVWGIGSYFTPSSDPIVASVDGQDIPRSRVERVTQQLQQQEVQQIQQLQQMSDGKIDLPRTPMDQLRRTALQRLVENAVMTDYADQAGYRVSDAAVLADLRDNPQFQQSGRFSADRYRALLAQNGIAPAQYEASIRRDLQSSQLRNEMIDSAFASPTEVDQAYRLATQERKIRYLGFDPSAYRDQVEISDSDIQKYYDANAGQFQRPERVKLAYVSLDRASAAADNGTPDQKALRQVYDQNKATLGEPEKRSGGEIRVPIEDDGSAARDTIQNLASGAESADLVALAEGVEDATYTPLEAVRQADLPPAVGEALFAMDPETTSAPVRGEDAWYLLTLNNVTPASTPPFDDPQMQAQLAAIAQAQANNAAFRDKSDQLEALAYEAPNDLQTLADRLGLEIQQTDWIDASGGPGLGQYDAIRKAAFSDAVLNDKLNSTPIQLGAERQVVLRVAEHQDAQARPLADVSERISSMLATRQASQLAREAAQKTLDKIREGADMASLTGDGVTLETPDFIGRGDDSVDARIREAAFALSRPDEAQPKYDIAATSDGMIALIAVEAVRASEDDDNGTSREQFADQQRQYVAQQEFAAMSGYLRTQADIEVNEARIN